MHGEIYGNLQRRVAIQPSQKTANDFSTPYIYTIVVKDAKNTQ